MVQGHAGTQNYRCCGALDEKDLQTSGKVFYNSRYKGGTTVMWVRGQRVCAGKQPPGTPDRTWTEGGPCWPSAQPALSLAPCTCKTGSVGVCLPQVPQELDDQDASVHMENTYSLAGSLAAAQEPDRAWKYCCFLESSTGNLTEPTLISESGSVHPLSSPLTRD